MTGRREFIGALPGLAALARLPAVSQGLVQGAWAGAVTPHGATLKVLASSPGLVLSLLVWVNTVPWITKRNESTREGWAPYARERRRIADHVVRTGLTGRLVMLSGDAHMLAMDDGTHSQYSTLPEAPARGFVVAHAAPMDRRPTKKGGPYTCPEVAQNGQYGVMDVHDDGARVRVRLQGMRGGLAGPGMRLEMTGGQ